MRIEQLLYLSEIVQQGTITKAAERLHVSQPNLSTAIKELERELGCTLFIRSKSGVVPTKHGEMAYQYAVEILNKLEDLRMLSGHLLPGTKSTLRIATIPSLNHAVIGVWVSAFHERYPNILLYNTEHSSSQVAQDVLNGTADIGFATFSEDASTHKALVLEKICDAFPYVCLGRELASRFSDPIAPDALSGIPFLSHSPEYGCHAQLLRALCPDERQSNIVFYSSDHSAIRTMVKNNQGAAIFSSIALVSDTDMLDGKLIPFHVQGYNSPSTLYAVRRRDRPYSAEAKEFLKIASAQIQKLLSQYFPQNYR